MSEQQPASSKPAVTFRPPDSVLPKLENAGTRRRLGEPDIYLSWGGEVYGPATVDDVVAGVRASWFEPDALYWFEGQSEWLPVSGFPEIAPTLPARRNPPTSVQPAEGGTHEDAGAGKGTGASSRSQKRPKMPKAPKPKGDYRGIGIVLAFVLLAVGLTVGILLLLHIFVRG